MDPVSFIVRAVCRELDVQSPIQTYRVEVRVREELSALCGGEVFKVRVPKVPFAERAKRHRAILADHAAGDRAAELARRHGLTVRRINQILQAAAAAGPKAPWTID